MADQTPTSPMRIRGALLAVQMLFGVNYLVSKSILATVPPPAWATLRAVTAFVVIAGLAAAGRRRLPPRGDILVLAVAAQFGIVLNQGLFLEGLARTTVGHSSLLCAQIPTFVLLFAVIARQETLTLRKFLGLLSGLAGVAVLLEADRFRWGGETLVGDLLTVANAASFALYLVISRRVMARNDPLAATAVTFFFGALGMAAWGGRGLAAVDPGSFDAGLLAAMAYAVVGATVATYFLNMWVIKRVAASRLAIWIFLQPVIATGLGVALRSEAVTPRFAAAMVLVFVALLLRDSRPRPQAAAK